MGVEMVVRRGGGALRKGLVSGASLAALLSSAVFLAQPASAQTAAPAPAAAQREIAFNIAGQDLNAALLTFARAAGLQVFYDAEWVKGKQSPGLAGNYTATQGLSKLLAGTGMTFRFTGPDTVALDKLPQSSDAMTLDPVAVEGRVTTPPQAQLTDAPPAFAGGQVARGGKVGMLGNKDIMDTPFTSTNYTSEVIKNTQARTLAQVLENDPAVRFTTSGGHINENFSIRGFNLGGSELALNGMYGMAPDGHVPTEFLERVEVLRGPNALLNGMSPGGTVAGAVNLVPKRATDKPVTEITGDFTSGSQLGSHVDVGRRFGTDGKLGVRVNGVLRDGDTGVDDQTKQRMLGTAALDYRGEDLRLNLDAYSMQEEFEGGSSLMAQLTGSGVPTAPDSTTNLFKGIYAQQDNNAAVLRGEYDISKNLTAFAGFGMADFQSEGFTNSTHAASVQANGNFTGQTTNRTGFTNTMTGEAGLRSNFQTGEVGHEAVFSASYLEQETGASFIRSATYASNLYSPTTAVLARRPGDPLTTGQLYLTSYAVADTLSFLDDRVELTLGARRQNVHSKSYTNNRESANYEKSAVTPAVGIVVKPLQSVSVFANYIEGLTKGSTVTDVASPNYNQTFAPFVSTQREAGIKWDAGGFANTLSFYRISQATLSSNATTKVYVQSEQVNKGIEWNTFGEVTEGLRLLGGISYTEGEIKKSAMANVVGKTPFGVPQWQGNLGVEWDPPVPALSGLTLEGRTVYTGEQFVNSTNTLKIPSWWRFDAGLRYVLPVQDNTLTFRGYVTNLFDKDYWAGSFSDNYVTLSEPRTYMLSVTAGF